ncbi:MAG: hypothetical protein GY869_13585 [Planctomycetes bacterium]|nr:hypothetical protein [Planctomycetota bacterium]
MVGKKRDITRRLKKDAFLRAFAQCGNVTQAAKCGLIHRDTHYAWLASDPEYFDAFEMAKQEYVSMLEAECDRRALDGWNEPVYQNGKMVGVERKYSDILLIFRMKKLDPSYREHANISVSRKHGPDRESMVETMEVLKKHGLRLP